MRVSQLSWLLLILLALFTGFAGGRYWEHQLGRSPADWRIPTPPYQISHAPLANGPYGGPPASNYPSYSAPPYNPEPTALPPQNWNPPAPAVTAAPRYAPPVAAAPSMLPADMPPPKSSLTAAGKAKVESLSEIREMIGGQLSPEGPAFAKSPEAALMFEEALRTVVAEELAKPKEEEGGLTPAAIDAPPLPLDSALSPEGTVAPDVAPTLDPPAVLQANEGSSNSSTPTLSPELTAAELLKTPHLVPARSENGEVEELPAGAEELRGAARMVEEQAAQAEEAGQYERADALRLISQALWQVARSGKR